MRWKHTLAITFALLLTASPIAISQNFLGLLPTDSLVGRDTAGTGQPESITLGTGIEFTGSNTIQRSALTGDVTASAGSNATSIADDKVTEADFKAVDAAGDEECLTYESTVGDFEWQTCGAGGLATTDIDTSAELRAIMTDEVDTGVLVFLGTPADDQVPVGASAADTTWTTITDSNGTNQALQYDQGTNAFSAVTITPSPWTYVFKTADESTASDTTLNDDAVLTVPVAASKSTVIEFSIYIHQLASSDFKFAVTGPATPTAVMYTAWPASGAACTPGTGATGTGTAYISSTSVAASAACLWQLAINMTLKNGTNAGNVTFQWAQNSSVAENTIVRAGSYVKYKQVD